MKSVLLMLFGSVLYVSGTFKTALAVEFGSINLVVGDIAITVEYADTFSRRAQGLMYRDTLCQQCGMFFKFDQEKYAAMWMKNTSIPLDVAYIDKQGRITDILALKPHDLTARGASRPVRYALEMNQGWFAKHGVAVGDTVQINVESNEAGATPD